MAKNLDHYRKKGGKNPVLSWLIRLPATYIVIFALILASSAGYLFLKDLNKSEPIQETPPPAKVAVDLQESSNAHAWLKSLLSGSGLPKWSGQGEVEASRIFPDLECTALDERNIAHTATVQLSNGENRLIVQTAAPGTARYLMEQYVQELSTCLSLNITSETIGDGETPFVKINDQYGMFVLGDALFAIKIDGNLTEQVASLISELTTSLKNSSCLSQTVSESTYKRNKFVSEDEYTGLVETVDVKTTVSLGNLPTIKIPEWKEVKDPGAKQPEGPLSSAIQDEPQKPDKVNLIGKPQTMDEFKDVAKYQIVDVEGPACGWAWSKWETPTETDAQLADQKKQKISIVQTRVDNEASAYVDSHTNWAMNSSYLLTKVNEWNSYVVETDAIHDKWDWLDKERAKIKEPWADFVKKYNFWFNFDKLQQDADDKYSTDSQACKDARKEQQDWDKQYEDTGSNGGGNTGIPPRPEGCDKDPEKPAILDQDRPQEPIPPDMADGVTIPDSWPQKDE